jgi:hypothetical protein
VRCWECHAQFWNVVNVEGNAVEAVADVELDEIDWAEGRVCEEDFSEDALQGMTELHRFHCG